MLKQMLKPFKRAFSLPNLNFILSFVSAGELYVRFFVLEVGCAVASWLVRSTPGPGRGHCVVFLGKTLYSHGASLHPGV